MASDTDHGLWRLRSLSGFSVRLDLLYFFENLTFWKTASLLSRVSTPHELMK